MIISAFKASEEIEVNVPDDPDKVDSLDHEIREEYEKVDAFSENACGSDGGGGSDRAIERRRSDFEG